MQATLEPRYRVIVIFGCGRLQDSGPSWFRSRSLAQPCSGWRVASTTSSTTTTIICSRICLSSQVLSLLGSQQDPASRLAQSTLSESGFAWLDCVVRKPAFRNVYKADFQTNPVSSPTPLSYFPQHVVHKQKQTVRAFARTTCSAQCPSRRHREPREINGNAGERHAVPGWLCGRALYGECEGLRGGECCWEGCERRGEAVRASVFRANKVARTRYGDL